MMTTPELDHAVRDDVDARFDDAARLLGDAQRAEDAAAVALLLESDGDADAFDVASLSPRAAKRAAGDDEDEPADEDDEEIDDEDEDDLDDDEEDDEDDEDEDDDEDDEDDDLGFDDDEDDDDDDDESFDDDDE